MAHSFDDYADPGRFFDFTDHLFPLLALEESATPKG